MSTDIGDQVIESGNVALTGLYVRDARPGSVTATIGDANTGGFDVGDSSDVSTGEEHPGDKSRARCQP